MFCLLSSCKLGNPFVNLNVIFFLQMFLCAQNDQVKCTECSQTQVRLTTRGGGEFCIMKE